MINTTYDDVVTKFDFDDYRKTIDDFSVPDVSDISDSVQTVTVTLTDLSSQLDNAEGVLPSPPSAAYTSIRTKLTALENSVSGIQSDVTNVVNNVGDLDLQPVKTSISNLEADLTSTTSSVKNDVYAESSFIKSNTLAFIDQFSDSLINKFGSCQVTFCG